MRLVTWNVNSIRTRVERVIEVLQRWDIDVLAMQELKCKPEQFPFEAFTQAGYQVKMVGLNQWNGVAIASRIGIENVQIGFPGQPAYEGVVEARAIGATCGGVEVWSLYVPNGRELSHSHYAYKLEWLSALRNHMVNVMGDRYVALVGDWNIAPFDHDVWDIKAFEGATHVSLPEREAFHAFAEIGMVEVTRDRVDNYTYWDYQKLRFPKNEGMRIDFVYVSPALESKVTSAYIDRDERKGKGASDHVPVIVDFSL